MRASNHGHMAYSNFSIGPNLSNGFTNTGNFTDVTGNQRTNAWAFDVLNVASAIQVGIPAVPEQGTWAMMLLGFAIGISIRRSRGPRLRTA